MKDKILGYLNEEKHRWWTVTIVPGFYAIVYLYLKNYTLVNSWQQLASFICCFVILPSVIFLFFDFAFKKKIPTRRVQLYWSYLLINFSIIFSLSIYLGWRWKGLLLFAIVVISASFFLAKHYKKIVLLLSCMLFIAVGQLLYFLVTKVSNSNEWIKEMPFESVVFDTRPNVYVIQPDGFVGRRAGDNPLYNLKLEEFYNTLSDSGFQFNHNFRSNYPTTLASNSTLFTAQHHYLNYGDIDNELLNARDIILGDNPVIKTFKKNGYQTNVILEHSYLMLNYPEVAYENNNVSYNDLSPLLPNYFLGKNYQREFENMVVNASSEPQFFFIEILHPGHISFSKDRKDAIKFETERYKQEIDSISKTIIEMVQFIEKNDPESIIILLADHGGFVGYSHTGAAYNLPESNEDLKQSVFNALYAVKTPYGSKIHPIKATSSISVFPRLFDHLSSMDLTTELQLDNSSYLLIDNKSHKELYQYYDSKGNSVSKKITRDSIGK